MLFLIGTTSYTLMFAAAFGQKYGLSVAFCLISMAAYVAEMRLDAIERRLRQ